MFHTIPAHMASVTGLELDTGAAFDQHCEDRHLNGIHVLIYWCLDNIEAVMQTTFSNPLPLNRYGCIFMSQEIVLKGLLINKSTSRYPTNDNLVPRCLYKPAPMSKRAYVYVYDIISMFGNIRSCRHLNKASFQQIYYEGIWFLQQQNGHHIKWICEFNLKLCIREQQ